MRIIIEKYLGNFVGIMDEIRNLVEEQMPDCEMQKARAFRRAEPKKAAIRDLIRTEKALLDAIEFPKDEDGWSDCTEWKNYLPPEPLQRQGNPQRFDLIDRLVSVRSGHEAVIRGHQREIEKIDAVLRRRLAAIDKKMEWLRSVTIAVPNDFVGCNLAKTISWWNRTKEEKILARVKTYFELGVSCSDGVWKKNKRAIKKDGSVICRRSKWYFFPFSPSVECLEELSETWHIQSSVYILHDGLPELTGAEVREGTVPPMELELEVSDWCPKLDKDSIAVLPEGLMPKWACNYLHKLDGRTGEFEIGDRVLVAFRQLSKYNAAAKNRICEGQEVYYAGTVDETKVKLGTGSKAKAWTLGRNGRVQHAFVRTVEQCLGLPPTQHFTLIGNEEIVKRMSERMMKHGLFNLTLKCV